MVDPLFKTLNDFIATEKEGLVVGQQLLEELDTSKRVSEMCQGLKELGCSGDEIALQFTALLLYDLVVLLGLDTHYFLFCRIDAHFHIDDSSSMDKAYEQGKTSPVDTMQRVLKEVAKIYELARPGKDNKDRGIVSVRFLNTRQGLENVTFDQAKMLKFKIKHNGVTSMATRLENKILQPYFDKQSPSQLLQQTPFQPLKPLLVMIITDGDPLNSTFSASGIVREQSRASSTFETLLEHSNKYTICKLEKLLLRALYKNRRSVVIGIDPPQVAGPDQLLPVKTPIDPDDDDVPDDVSVKGQSGE
ncbi:hypothetical protein K440DRAFT_642120 [Wilcoxina mikolae CBS 423.85]|nr:hypothetical protein K440DRAFT_642120 [Wilcoxina mikolae CBS 423.85]